TSSASSPSPAPSRATAARRWRRRLSRPVRALRAPRPLLLRLRRRHNEVTTMEAIATLKYLKASPQKVRLVVDLVRGKKVEEALQILRFTRKTVAKDLAKLVRSAVANAENKEANVDTDELVVSKIFVNEGPREKRVQPAQ